MRENDIREQISCVCGAPHRTKQAAAAEENLPSAKVETCKKRRLSDVLGGVCASFFNLLFITDLSERTQILLFASLHYGDVYPLFTRKQAWHSPKDESTKQIREAILKSKKHAAFYNCVFYHF
jgi:hypothetical protein